MATSNTFTHLTLKKQPSGEMRTCNDALLHPGMTEHAMDRQTNVVFGPEFQYHFGLESYSRRINGQYLNHYFREQLSQVHYINGMLHSRDENIVFNLRINKLIAISESLSELLELIQYHAYYFNEINISTILHKIATLCLSNGSKAKIKKDGRFKLLMEIIVFRSNLSCRFYPKELSNIAWSLVKLGINSQILFEIIGKESIVQIERFGSINLSIVLWSFAKAGKFNKNLFIYAIPKILSELENLTPQQISNIAWSYSKVGLISPHFFENLKRRSIQTIERFLPIHVSMLCYAFSWADIVPTELYETISMLDIVSFSPKALAHIFWSFSLAEFKFPLDWLFWVNDEARISSLSHHELNLLIISLCLNFIKGFVFIRHLKPNDYGFVDSNSLHKVSISKALSTRDKDSENIVIEWSRSGELLNITKVKSEIDLSNYDLFIWDVLDILSLKLYKTFRRFREISDIVWMLTLIGKDTSMFIRTKSQTSNSKDVLKILDENSCISVEDKSSASNTCDASPFSTCCNSESPEDKSNRVTPEEIFKSLENTPSSSNAIVLCGTEAHYLSESIILAPSSLKSNHSSFPQDANSISSIMSLFVYSALLVLVVLFY